MDQGRIDRQGRRPAKNDQWSLKRAENHISMNQELFDLSKICHLAQRESNEEHEFEDTVKQQQVDILINCWNDIHVKGHFKSF